VNEQKNAHSRELSLAHRACGAVPPRGGRFTSVPLGQQLWEKELLSLQAPETYHLDGILKAIQAGETPGQ
jgi:hypothetical protein